MKAKELIEKLKMFEEFDVEFHFTDGYSKFPNIRKFSIDEICDVGYSDKVVVLDGKEELRWNRNFKREEG